MKLFLSLFLLLPITIFAAGQTASPLSVRLADTAMHRIWTDSGNPPGIPRRWTYDQGVINRGLEMLWYKTGDAKYFDHIKGSMDFFLNADGTIKGYTVDEFNIDNVTPGRSVLLSYNVTGTEKYKKTADLLRSQLKSQPRTKEGGFWHKKIYPNQMWLDGLYMGEPFYTEYSKTFHEDNYTDIANQFAWMEKNSRDTKTGLLYHGWDESKVQKWANKDTGVSPNFWGRAMGWYAMALVDVLDTFPKNNPRRADLIAILNRTAAGIEKFQDKDGLWWDVMDKPGAPKNYHESSCAAMFVYALAKGVREGYLPEKYLKTAQKGWAGINKEFVETLPDGTVNWKGTVSVSGLGGNPYRDGSYDYYMGEKVIVNDPKGLGAAIQAAVEMEKLDLPQPGAKKTVLLDDYFNHETKKDATGATIAWHYKWDEQDNGGYSIWGKVFNSYGAKTETLSAAPTAANLKNADVYIIVDPDDEKETPTPNFIQASDIKAITDWVKAGGVLVLMGNDFGNCEFDHFNNLAKEFGIQFNKDSKNHVDGNQYEQGKIMIDPANPVFKTAKKVYLKEISTFTLTAPAKSIQEWNGDKVMAISKLGKGTVFAVGDPWVYNEYTDGRKLPADFDNFKAANDLSLWLLGNTRKK